MKKPLWHVILSGAKNEATNRERGSREILRSAQNDMPESRFYGMTGIGGPFQSKVYRNSINATKKRNKIYRYKVDFVPLFGSIYAVSEQEMYCFGVENLPPAGRKHSIFR